MKYSIKDKALIERVLEMESGYVLDFSDATMMNFVAESVEKDIHDVKYQVNGSSKAKKLRTFIDMESDEIVTKLLLDMLERKRDRIISSYGISNESGKNKNSEIDSAVYVIQKSSLSQSVAPAIHETLTGDFGRVNVALLADDVKKSILEGCPQKGLDRMHTYLVGFLRSRCEKHQIPFDESDTINSMIAKLIKIYESKGYIQSDCSLLIAKSQISIFEKFNHVRNRQSLAHDNEILGNSESLYLLNSIVGSIRFIREIDL